MPACQSDTPPLVPHLTPSFFALVIFSHLCPGWPGLKSYLCFPCNWDERCTTPTPGSYGLRWGLVNFLPRLAWNQNSLISALGVARITGTGLQLGLLCLALKSYFEGIA
jgi:hypothetical protein